MKTTDALTPEILRDLMEYFPETGEIRWKFRDRHHFESDRIWAAWNSQNAGKAALTADNGNGYKFGNVLCKRVYAHRAAWALHFGEWPSMEIDHANRIKSDNRIDNLRDVSHVANCQNRGVRKGNVSGHKYISFDKARGRWLVMFKNKNIGRFLDLEDAIRARDAVVPKEACYG